MLNSCHPITPKCTLEILNGGLLPENGMNWRLENELKPSDLYCYLYAKFGPPNGMQNLLRGDHSDNLIHWEWTFGHKNGLVFIQGQNFRTEIHLLGDWDEATYGRDEFLTEVRADLAVQGPQMAEIRRSLLEDWTMFVNPFRTLRAAIDNLKVELDTLQLNPEEEQLANPTAANELPKFRESFTALAGRYDRGIGLSMALRLMIPVLAEAFVNLVLFVLCRSDIKQNQRLYEAAVRANIDVKIQSLHIQCNGFSSPVDWASKACSNYNKLVNERNDLLHGNLVVDKLKYGEIYFNQRVPVFKRYDTLWQQSMGVSVRAAGVERVDSDLGAAEGLIQYILSCMEPDVREQLEAIMEKRDLGENRRTGRMGVLLPDYMVDFHLSPERATR